MNIREILSEQARSRHNLRAAGGWEGLIGDHDLENRSAHSLQILAHYEYDENGPSHA